MWSRLGLPSTTEKTDLIGEGFLVRQNSAGELLIGQSRHLSTLSLFATTICGGCQRPDPNNNIFNLLIKKIAVH